MSLAVFLLPKGDFALELVRWKGRVKKELLDQPYTAHPPHMTLINIKVKNEEDGVAAISALSNSTNPFQITVNRKDVFWDDTTTGGHTLFFGVENNDNLYALQISLAEALQKMKKNVPPSNYLIDNKQLLESYNKYGFPFVGEHWIPHFSISSLRTEKTHPIIEDFLSTPKQYDFTANQISLWRVDDDEHTLLETVYFK
ncbi:2'-5' RNA ligase family protein [Candidatus Marinimicrobia bacterium]|nr:2'-5' RNA ligase family protein [Candidatus Neomarinimicrobiota bacterium]